jgi:hypothetical protein
MCVKEMERSGLIKPESECPVERVAARELTTSYGQLIAKAVGHQLFTKQEEPHPDFVENVITALILKLVVKWVATTPLPIG